MSGWRKSSRSGSNGCVEVAIMADAVQLRDSKDPASPVLSFTWHEWQVFLDAMRVGEFDLVGSGWQSAEPG